MKPLKNSKLKKRKAISSFEKTKNIDSIGEYRSKHIFSRKVPTKRTWVLAVLLLAAEFKLEPLAPNVFSYETRPAAYPTR